MDLQRIIEAVENYPNNYQLGEAIRNMYWEYKNIDIDNEEEIDKVAIRSED